MKIIPRRNSIYVYIIIAALIAVGIASLRKQRGVADYLPEELASAQIVREIEISQIGEATYINPNISSRTPLKNAIKPHGAGVRLLFKVFDEPGSYLGTTAVKVKLPPSVPANTVTSSAWLIHSVDTRAEHEVSGQNEITFLGREIGPAAIYTVQIDFPPGAIKLSALKRISGILSSLPLKYWVILAIMLPVITLMFLLIMVGKYTKQLKILSPHEIIPLPPSNLPPAMVGLLINSRLGPKEVSATLLDLAVRNHLTLIYNGGNFTLRRGAVQPTTPLQSFEQILLSKIFYDNQNMADLDDIEFRVGHRIYSKKIAQVYLDLYARASQLNWFIKNPSTVHRRWHFGSLILFMVALVGFVWGMILAPEPKTPLFFWIGMMGAALVVNGLAYYLPLRSQVGDAELQKWLGFKNFLTDPMPVGYSEAISGIFSKFLPYAIVFDCEIEFLARFREHPFVVPNWYQTNSKLLEEFSRELFPLLEFIGTKLATSSEPGVN